MTTQEVATRLVELCREGQYMEAAQELYSPHIISIEPDGTPHPKVQGMEAIAKKGEAWRKMVDEIQSSFISDPIVAENFFSVTMKSTVRMKDQSVINMEELCVYTVADGKVVQDQFFYSVPN
jgi:hypothetical protein